LWSEREDILASMDLRGSYQRKNLRTTLTALTVLNDVYGVFRGSVDGAVDALVHTARRTGFRGRWEQVSENPRVICDIGHNEHGLKYNFTQLKRMLESGEISKLIVLYGSVADKDVDAAVRLFPDNATYIFTRAQGKRAMPAEEVRGKYLALCAEDGRPVAQTYCCETVADAGRLAYQLVESCEKAGALPADVLIYVGGSTYVVSEFLSTMA
jgi:dihydrofolate synthase/folylpolyglutamate synthase